MTINNTAENKDCSMPKVEETIVDKDQAKKQKSGPPYEVQKAANSPDVFISYQWDKKSQILKLYNKLTSLGYTCWMDRVNIGGGDEMDSEIERGLRECSVVLLCITSEYAGSNVCRKEVSLAHHLKKPLIPLRLDSSTWPPKGSMGLILTQLLYIDCTKDGMEDTWDGPKFDEIITMITKHIPDKAPAVAQNPAEAFS